MKDLGWKDEFDRCAGDLNERLLFQTERNERFEGNVVASGVPGNVVK